VVRVACCHSATDLILDDCTLADDEADEASDASAVAEYLVPREEIRLEGDDEDATTGGPPPRGPW
jgi:hypothetical protein